ncbi:MAG: sigma-70 family RNA polymerase sigma factor [Clostridia bacterium]|nr:sigma-70 family RNA polymerase sigma factor [Clostridia bacterium]
MQDHEIISLYFDRNEQAITESDKKYGAYCFSVSMNILASRPDAEECINDTWMRAWGAMPPHRPNNLKTFLGKITRNLSIDRLRKRSRRAELELTVLMSELEEAVTLSDDTDENTLTSLFDDFLRGLPALDRRLFVGRYWYGYRVAFLADKTGMTPNAVSHRIRRVREAFRAYLEKRGYTV